MKAKHNRINRITIRLNDSEINNLEFKASMSGVSRSVYIRHIILHSKPHIHKFDKAMVNQLSRVGNNLNQIAKHVNISRAIDRMVLKQILDVNKKLDNLIDKK